MVQVRAKHFYRYAGTSTREHGVDTMTYGRSYLYIHSRYLTKTLTDIRQQLILASVFQHVWCFYLRRVDPKGMLVEFGSTRLPSHHLYLWYGKKDFLSSVSYLVRLVEGYSWQSAYVDSERAFVEWRQEAATKTHEYDYGSHQCCSCCRHYNALMTQGPTQGFSISLF